MNILFFQNCVSPHQMPYIEVLANSHNVTVVVPFVSYENREQMGWSRIEQSQKVRIVVAPANSEVEEIMQSSTKSGRTVALFSGISAFREVKIWFRMSLNYDMDRGIITEAPYTYGKPLWMHKLRFLVQDLRYVKHVKYVFAIGRRCEEYYRIWSKRWKVVPFAYCVSDVDRDGETQKEQDPGNDGMGECDMLMCSVSSIDDRKNVSMQLDALVRLRGYDEQMYDRCHLTIVGDGPLRKDLEQYAAANDLNGKVSFIGAKPMKEAREIIAQSDVLMLTSKHDGWGAVVNEALMAGTRVICTDTCGAEALIDNAGERGQVVRLNDVNALVKAICNLDKRNLKDAGVLRRKIADWAHSNIGPEAIAKRMEMEICNL